MTDWVRLWHDMPTDPKWRVVARKSKQPLPCVIAVFTMMLTNASANSDERGVLLAWDHEDAGAALDMDAEDVAAIYEAMQGKVLEGNRLTGWERRQPKREDNTAAERKAAWKARKEAEKNAVERTGTHGNAAERTREDTDTDTDKIDSVSKDTGADAPAVDPEKQFWADAKAYLKPRVKSDPGALINKWLRERGKPLTMAALNAAQLERAVDPPAYLEGYFRRHSQNGQQQPAVPL